MVELRRTSLVKPTIHTRYHIDFDWWSRNDRDWRVYLISNLCSEHREGYQDPQVGELVDFVDPNTAEVQRVDGLQHILISHCARQPDFITDHSALVDAVFRLFLANGNMSMSCVELSERLGKQAETILRTLSGALVYKGLRPWIE